MSFLQLPTALYEWAKECPKDLRKDLETYFTTKEFLDRENVFYKGKGNRPLPYLGLGSISQYYSPLHVEESCTLTFVSFHRLFSVALLRLPAW